MIEPAPAENPLGCTWASVFQIAAVMALVIAMSEVEWSFWVKLAVAIPAGVVIGALVGWGQRYWTRRHSAD